MALSAHLAVTVWFLTANPASKISPHPTAEYSWPRGPRTKSYFPPGSFAILTGRPCRCLGVLLRGREDRLLLPCPRWLCRVSRLAPRRSAAATHRFVAALRKCIEVHRRSARIRRRRPHLDRHPSRPSLCPSTAPHWRPPPTAKRPQSASR